MAKSHISQSMNFASHKIPKAKTLAATSKTVLSEISPTSHTKRVESSKPTRFIIQNGTNSLETLWEATLRQTQRLLRKYAGIAAIATAKALAAMAGRFTPR